MDYEEMSKAYNNAKGKYEPYKPKEYEKNIWKTPNPEDAYPHLPAPKTKTTIPQFNPPTKKRDVEVDYGIVKMGDNSYIVVRSHYLGSLDYDVVCNCESRHEAREIVRALNK